MGAAAGSSNDVTKPRAGFLKSQLGGREFVQLEHLFQVQIPENLANLESVWLAPSGVAGQNPPTRYIGNSASGRSARSSAYYFKCRGWAFIRTPAASAAPTISGLELGCGSGGQRAAAPLAKASRAAAGGRWQATVG